MLSNKLTLPFLQVRFRLRKFRLRHQTIPGLEPIFQVSTRDAATLLIEMMRVIANFIIRRFKHTTLKRCCFHGPIKYSDFANLLRIFCPIEMMRQVRRSFEGSSEIIRRNHHGFLGSTPTAAHRTPNQPEEFSRRPLAQLLS